VLLAVGLLISLPVFLFGVPYGLDLPHHYRIAQGFQEALAGGNFYPSWLASTNGGYGDPSLRFYPPALYYLLSCARLLTGDWYYASLLSIALLTLTGCLGIYLWARTLLADWRYAVIAALVYSLAPYHANELYQAGMYGQYAAACILPFTFAFAERIIQHRRLSDVAGCGLSYGLLILFHVPLAVLSTITLAIYCLLRLTETRRFVSLYRLTAGALLGVALSCCYWLPVMRELKWKFPSGAGQGEWFNYRNNFLFQQSPSEMSNFLLPMLTAGTILIAAPAAILFFKRDRKALAPALAALCAFLMATPLSRPLWDALPILQETQFPWRWMTPLSACLSILVALSFPALASLRRTRWRPFALALMGLLVIALSFTVLQLMRGATFRGHAAFNGFVDSLPGSATNKDFLPIWASEPRPMNLRVEAGERSVDVSEWSAERRVFQIDAGLASEARLRTFYYPYWVATSGQQVLPTKPADDGALLIGVPQQAATINVEFREPLSSKVAGAVSLAGLFAALGLLLSQRLQQRRART
jgi:uncharacterized membrane protein